MNNVKDGEMDLIDFYNKIHKQNLEKIDKLKKSMEEKGFVDVKKGGLRYIITKSSKQDKKYQMTCLIDGKPISDSLSDDYMELIERLL